jgi:histidinol-phosphate aminotransferase
MARQFGESNPMKTNSISRRHFAQLLGVGAACAVARPSLALAKSVQEPATHPVREGVVRLSSNENPFGPSPKALKAMTEAFNLACRYPDERADELVSSLAKMNGVESSQILLGDGSGEILKLCADVFTGPLANTNPAAGRGALVVADPTFEAILVHAQNNDAEVVKIPLTDSYAHDLAKMMDSAKEGLVYVCNPNNPTASISPKNEVRSFIEKAPPKTMILVDEAYYHYADSGDYESVIPLVQDHPNLIVARTFSKIYGMAGLRCGYCIASSMIIERLRARQAWDSVNIMAVAAATASLDDSEPVARGRQLNTETRAFTVKELEGMGYRTIPSQANFIMIDLKRPVVPIIASLRNLKVDVGRLFRAMPNHLRLTIGRKAEMESFLAAFRQVMA